MTEEQYLLILLNEELSEVQQRVSKAIRFSLSEIEPGQNLTNKERIIYEFNDIIGVLECLEDRNIFTKKEFQNNEMVEKKKIKIEKYLNYSKKLKIVKE